MYVLGYKQSVHFLKMYVPVCTWYIRVYTLTDPTNLDMGCIYMYIHGIYMYIHGIYMYIHS